MISPQTGQEVVVVGPVVVVVGTVVVVVGAVVLVVTTSEIVPNAYASRLAYRHRR